MPFRDAGGVQCLLLSDLWDEPIVPHSGDTLMAGSSGRSRRASNGGFKDSVFAQISHFIVVDHGPNFIFGRFTVHGCTDQEDPDQIASDQRAVLVAGGQGEYGLMDDALEFAAKLNICAGVQDS